MLRIQLCAALFVCGFTLCGLQAQSLRPDTATFFPLLKGSYWHYETFLEGEVQDGQWHMDSVAEVHEKSAQTVVKMIRKTSNGIMEFSYEIRGNGMVYKTEGKGKPVEYCMLLPREHAKIGDKKYTAFLDTQKRRIRLESTSYENGSEQEQMVWQGIVFEKGIGVVSEGGADIGLGLVRYRIGTTHDEKEYE